MKRSRHGKKNIAPIVPAMFVSLFANSIEVTMFRKDEDGQQLA